MVQEHNENGNIPEIYNNPDMLGYIVYYIFSGVNLINNSDVTSIGNTILYNNNKYDFKNKKVIPLIEGKQN